jgi:threonyl-tRNA synthetase
MKEVGYNDYVVDVGGAVFYGPKIDFKLLDSLGRKWQLSTVQFDFNLPSRFNMKYMGKDGKEHTPYMIHRALLGSLERFMGIFIEHTAGNFPVWMVPIQVKILPVKEGNIVYASEVLKTLKAEGIRAELDDNSNSLSEKIKVSQKFKIPYIVIIGDKELQNKNISIRTRDNLTKQISLKDFILQIQNEIKNKVM